MRTRGVAVLAMALLASSAVGVAGQSMDVDPAAVEPVHVTGSARVDSFTQDSLDYEGEYFLQARGGLMTLREEMSDPRASGLTTISFDYDQYIPAEMSVLSGTIRVEADHGAWHGEWSGAMRDGDLLSGQRDTHAWLRGEGAFEGLSYHRHANVDAGHVISVEGLIYQGDPPSPRSEEDWTARVTGAGNIVAGPNQIHIAVLASDLGGQFQYARRGLQFYATVECLSVTPDGSSAVAAGPARSGAGALPDEWAQLDILEGGPDGIDLMRVAFVGANDGARCESSGDYPGEVIDGDFDIHTR